MNNLGREGARGFVDGLCTNCSLTDLNLSHNLIGPEGVRGLVNWLTDNTTLKTLNLRGNDLGCDGAEILADIISSNETITKLDLRDNNLGPEGVRGLLVSMFANTTLTELNLNNNRLIGPNGDWSELETICQAECAFNCTLPSLQTSFCVPLVAMVCSSRITAFVAKNILLMIDPRSLFRVQVKDEEIVPNKEVKIIKLFDGTLFPRLYDEDDIRSNRCC